MSDLKESKIFRDTDDEDDFNDWYFLEEQANWLFSNAPNSEKIDAIKSIKVKQDEFEKTKKSQYFLDQEKRILVKQKEMIANGLVPPDAPDPTYSTSQKAITTRYGRSPLHEAISMRDIRLVKKYIKSEKYLDKVDNNGHTAMEMAFYEGYKEALVLFRIYDKKKK